MADAVETVARPSLRPHWPPVVVDPLARCLLALVLVLALWTFVRIGRVLCLVAQHVPVVVSWSGRCGGVATADESDVLPSLRGDGDACHIGPWAGRFVGRCPFRVLTPIAGGPHDRHAH